MQPVVRFAGQQGDQLRRWAGAPQLGGQFPVFQVQTEMAAGLLIAGEGGEQQHFVACLRALLLEKAGNGHVQIAQQIVVAQQEKSVFPGEGGEQVSLH